MTDRLRVAIAGLGYFSRFHLEAWTAHPKARLVGLCDPDLDRLKAAPRGVVTTQSLTDLLAKTDVDILDIVAPPRAHFDLITAALAPDRMIICQKPFSQSPAEAAKLTALAKDADTQLVIHENFRFQPWYRATKAFLDGPDMGRVFQARFALRPGDGRGADAYLARQPIFQSMPRFLFHETGVHLIDLFRWLLGPVQSVYAEHQRLNPAISGEDCGLIILHHANGARSMFDGNRLSDHASPDLRRTMGEMRIEGEGGVLDLDGTGGLQFRAFGETHNREIPVPSYDRTSFGGGCVARLIDHVIDAKRGGQRPENLAEDYLPVVDIVAAAYHSAETGQRVML